MRRFETVDGVAALLDRDSIDTDQILPISFMRGIDPAYGQGLFALWRRDPAFILNQPGWQQTSILVSGANFGCGSTREQACWALEGFGIRVLIAASFGEVFRDNCVKNGILPIDLPAGPLDALRTMLRGAVAPLRLRVDLRGQEVSHQQFTVAFDFPPADKTALIDGVDEIGMTMRQADGIDGWEERQRARRPWWQTLRVPQ